MYSYRLSALAIQDGAESISWKGERKREKDSQGTGIMARIRTIKPEFMQSETIGNLSREARLLFIQLWTVADDAGRFRASSRLLASLLYPYDDDAPGLLSGWLSELEDIGCIRLYQVDGTTYADIPKWLKHQKIDRPSKSRLPEFDEDSRALATDLVPSTLDPGPSKKEISPNGDTKKNSEDDFWFVSFWEKYPRKRRGNRDKAWRASLQARRRGSQDEIMNGLLRYVASAEVARGFAKGAAAWLNDDRWTFDYIEPIKSNTSGIGLVASANELIDEFRSAQNGGVRDNREGTNQAKISHAPQITRRH